MVDWLCMWVDASSTDEAESVAIHKPHPADFGERGRPYWVPQHARSSRSRLGAKRKSKSRIPIEVRYAIAMSSQWARGEGPVPGLKAGPGAGPYRVTSLAFVLASNVSYL